jgi:hypothetical protein
MLNSLRVTERIRTLAYLRSVTQIFHVSHLERMRF